jgi:GTP-binding protein
LRKKQDLHIADLVEQEGRALIVAVNKWDLVEDAPKVLADLKEKLERLLPQIRGVPIVTFSALTGRGLDRLMPRIEEIHTLWNTRVTTSRLNRWLGAATSRHTPPAAKGRRVVLRYEFGLTRRAYSALYAPGQQPFCG